MNVIIVSEIDYLGNSAGAKRTDLFYRLYLQNGWNSVKLNPHFSHFSIHNKNAYGIADHNGRKRRLGIIAYFRFCRQLLESINDKENTFVFFYPTVNLVFTIITICFFKSKHIPIVIDLNEIRRYDISVPWIIRPFYIIQDFLFASYCRVICITPQIQEYLKRFSPRTNSIVIPALCEEYSVVSSSPRNRLVFTIRFTGSVSVKKENLICLFEGLLLANIKHPWVLELYGPTKQKDLSVINRYNNKLKTVHANGEILYKGQVEQDRVNDLLTTASLLVLPRKNNKQNYYAMSTKLVEYSRSGTPILMTDTSCVKDFFVDLNNCFYVNGYDGLSFKNALNRVFELYQDYYPTIQRNALLTASHRFVYTNYANVLVTLFK